MAIEGIGASSDTGVEDVTVDATPVANPSHVGEMIQKQFSDSSLRASFNTLGDPRYTKDKFPPVLHDLWEKCNVIVLSWIMNSVSNELLRGMVYATSAQKVWVDLRESFDKVNGSRILFLHRQIATLSQGISSMSVYFAKLKELWVEFYALMPCPGCGCEESKRYAEHFGNHSKEGIAMFSGKRNTQGFKQKRKAGPNNATQYIWPLTNSGPSSGSFEASANLAGLQQNNLDSTSQGGQGVIAGVPQFTVDQYNQILYLLGKSNITTSSQSDPQSSAMSAGMTPSFVATEAEVRWIVDTGASNHIVKRLKILEESRSTDETSIGKDLFNGRVRGIGKEDEGLYIYISGNKDQTNGGGNNNSDSGRSFVNTINDDSSSVSLWHMRLSHVLIDVLRKLKCFQYLKCNSETKQYTVCPIVKQTRLPFPLSTSVVTACFHLLHADVWGPYRVPTHDGKKYFLTLVDDHSKFTWVLLLPSKAEVIVAIKQFFTVIKNVYSCTVKFLRTDNGCEFFNSQMTELLQSLGIVHQSSCVYTPQ
uniref:Integrase catalytic domain-containing protein n=1 Tax=Nicotiana tabacum TaxID=4097 RepID=A0A1S3YNQ9_TOBAC|nr:PREDICTED: uncharacterized protein LOC107778214 [Nicotiana tabacum]